MCEDVSLLPADVVITHAEDEEVGLIDVHTFQRFYTYQIPKSNTPATNQVTTRFSPGGKDTGNDLILRLRASLKSAGMDNSDQSMKVTVLEENGGQVVVDASTEDNDERGVHLDSIELSSNKTYIIKYQFFEKNVGLSSFEDKTVSAAHMGASACSKPFVVQELVIANKDMITKRVRNYKEHRDNEPEGTLYESKERDLADMHKFCNFDMVNNTDSDLAKGESGLYCPRTTFSYPTHGESPQELNTIFDQKFTIVGAEKEQVTYLFDLTLGFDFASAAQLKAVVRRVDAGTSEKFNYDPLACLYDHSCAETEQVSKNELSLDVILTSGDYQLVIFDQQDNGVRQWLREDAGLDRVPFTFELQAVPIVQNEERVMCGDKLYLTEDFFQNRFITGRKGQKFTFDDQIILSLVNSSQSLKIVPEEDMILKVSSKQNHGVNMAITLCTDDDCLVASTQIGNTEMIMTAVTKGKTYFIDLDYTNSIITMSSYFDCPSAHLMLSMMKANEAETMLKEQEEKESGWIAQQAKASDSKLATIFNTLSEESDEDSEAKQLADSSTLLVYGANRQALGPAAENHLVTQRDFTIKEGSARQMVLEIFYDPQFYDMELMIESRDAGEDYGRRSYEGRQNLDITQYKGSKRVFASMEPGDYTVKISVKLPAAQHDSKHLFVKFYEFQLYVVTAETVPVQARRPASLNYYGLLGPKGDKFGSLTYLVQEITLGPREHVEFEFHLSGSEEEGFGPTIDVQVLESDGFGDQLDISLDEIPKVAGQLETSQGLGSMADPEDDDDDEDEEKTKHSPHQKTKKPKSTRYFDGWEDGIAYESLISTDIHENTGYRVRLKNRDSSTSAKAQLKLVISEHFDNSNSGSDNVPRSFEEVMRVKPKVPGLKESAFIQGSKSVMEAFKVASLQPFVPKSKEVYQAKFRTGENTDDSFMKGLDFDVDEQSSSIYVLVTEYSGREDLFVTIYEREGSEEEEIARSSLGKYANHLGPVSLTKGKYRLVIHPDQDSTSEAKGTEMIKFGLDVLFEKTDIGGAGDFDVIIEEVELCSLPSLPDNFNGPGFLHYLSGGTLRLDGKYKITELLEGTAIKFDLEQPSRITFYAEVPEGLILEAALNRVKGTYTTKLSSEELNRGDETFLRQEGSFDHRGIIQFREFLDKGQYMIKLQGREVASGSRVMPRCEAYMTAFSIAPITKPQAKALDEDCLDSQYVPEHLVFDEHKEGRLSYPLTENTVDVAYLDLKNDGEGPFLFDFSVQYDPRIMGVVAVSLSKYDGETSTFKQAALYSTPQDGLTQLFTVVESGTYAVGIQTLTSTRRIYQVEGLGTSLTESLGSKLLPTSCFTLKYNYIVASVKRGDSRAIQGASVMALMFSGGLQKMAAQQEQDDKLRDELGDASLFTNCGHDDLPHELPISETGFDQVYNLLVQQKPSDILDLVVEQESLLRITIHSNDPKNQVKAFLYENSSAHEAIAWTSGGRMSSSLIQKLEPEKRAYRIKIEYESLNEDDQCPTFHLRIMLKPLTDIVNENLHCHGKPMPRSTFSILQDNYANEGDYAFPSDFINKVRDGREEQSLEYDTIIEWPNANPESEYYLDVETRSDALTGRITFSLLYEDKHRELKQIGRSQQVETHKGGQFIQRLKLLEQEGDLADDINLSGAVLRIKLPASSVLLHDLLKASGHVERDQEICHSFTLSVRAEKREEGESDVPALGIPGLGEPSHLMRVRWEGERIEGGFFDPRSRIVAYLEFDRSMKESYQIIKSGNFAALVPEHAEETGSTRAHPDIVASTLVELSTDDPSIVMLQFAAGTLARGWSHKLVLKQLPGVGGLEDQMLVAADLLVNTTNCLCDPSGTSQCDEASGICHCRFPHAGADCGRCAEGHTRDPHSGDCRPATKCAEQGGDVSCNSHGTCEQRGEQAVCTCNAGFIDDGLEQCGKCADPLFEYPDCQLRSWIIEEPAVSCRGLEAQMPTVLFNSTPGSKLPDALQQEDGTLNWAQRYRLKDGKNRRHQSTHEFMVPVNSVFRLFVDTGNSGATIKYRLVDHETEEIISSSAAGRASDADGFVYSESEVAILHQPVDGAPRDTPFVLHLEYKYHRPAEDEEEDRCPYVDIHMIVEPLITAEESVKCSPMELSKTAEERVPSWEFGSRTTFERETIVLRSDDSRLYEHEGEESSMFAVMNYRISTRQGGNALSIIATYPFSSVQLSMTLFDQETGSVVKIERTSSLEGDEAAPRTISSEADMATYVEVPQIAAGHYRLEVGVQKALFLPTKQYPTCLSFDLVVEYVVRPQSGSQDKDMYDILAVWPLTMEHLQPTDKKVIEVDFAQHVILDDLVNGLADRFYVCQLYNNEDSKKTIHPHAVRNEDGSQMRLDFDFSKALIPATGRQCYQLKCSTQHTKAGVEKIRPMQLETSYCFETPADHDHDPLSKCNPLAQPKLDSDKSCICASPYTGRDCYECQTGFKSIKESRIGPDGKEEERTVCVVDSSHLTNAVCNSHGSPKSTRISHVNEVECNCDNGYAGRFCDFCSNPSFAFPDCEKEISAEIYDPALVHSFLTRRHYSEHGYSTAAAQYFSEGALEPSVFNSECGWVDYPDDFDRIEFSKEFADGELHFADFFVVNHQSDNIIKFKPRQTGVVKLLVQQPELNELLAGDTETSFDLEVGIYDPTEKVFVKSAMNTHLELAGGIPAKLEYAAASFEVKQDHVGKPLYIFFRALNFSEEGQEHKSTEGCLTLFIEAEFRTEMNDCNHHQLLKPSNDVQQLKETNLIQLLGDKNPDQRTIGQEYSIADPSQTFFTYQDYYVPAGPNNSPDRDDDRVITVSLQQKFIESNTLDVIIEILQSDVDFDQIRASDHSPRMSRGGSGSHSGLDPSRGDAQGRDTQIQGSQGPACNGVCLVGGEKSYNEMQRVVELGARTYFRIWLFQQVPDRRESSSTSCANFQLFVTMKTAGSDNGASDTSAQFRCPIEELPKSFNSPRFLEGPDGQQKDFHHKQSYRIDHLWHNRAHKITFKLGEPSLVRIQAPLHRHLDFELVLNQDQGTYNYKTLLRAKREDFHSMIFAELEAGEYHIKFAFVSDAALMHLPCQSVELEAAIMTLDRAQAFAETFRKTGEREGKTKISMSELLVDSSVGPTMFYKPQAVNRRHVEAGVPPYVDQTELFIEIYKEAFEIAADDDAGLFIELQSDFLLSGANVAINNVVTGQVIEGKRHDSSSRIVIEHMQPGEYDLIVYTHEAVTNMDATEEKTLSSFDLLLQLSVRLLRLADQHDGGARGAGVPIEILDYSGGSGQSPRVKDQAEAEPFVLDEEELRCFEQYLALPRTVDHHSITGTLDFSEQFYIPTRSYYTHSMNFTARSGQDALRVYLARSNSKIALYETSTRKMVGQSSSTEAGKGQLMLVQDLRDDLQYTIVLEFSEQRAMDGEAAEKCEHFVLALKSEDQNKKCPEVTASTGPSHLSAYLDSEPQVQTLVLSEHVSKRDFKVEGSQLADVTIILDYGNTFYRPAISLMSAVAEVDTSQNENAEDAEDAKHESGRGILPKSVDFTRKHSTSYTFTNVAPGAYILKFRQTSKPSGCRSEVVIQYQAMKALSASVSLDRPSISGQNLYQSQSEDQVRPRIASRLPLDLNTYKFMGGEANYTGEALDHPHYLLFSGPVQLDDLESNNRISFTVEKNDTTVKIYVEHTGIALALTEVSTGHSKLLGGGSGHSLVKDLARGSYQIQLTHATTQARKKIEVSPPRAQVSVLVASRDVHKSYNASWSHLVETCDEGSNFPLALRQQKQSDTHQLLYDYPLIKVSPSILRTAAVLQTYNFRVNVTSRLYFEVGMHMLNSQVTMQMSNLNEHGFTIQGKQRGNLNILDAEVAPGDYSIALKQAGIGFGWHQPQDTCGIFSLQGIIEPIDLMSAAANSGDIIQRGLHSCSEGADGDILPSKIHGSKSQTRGGGELHVDASGHFLRRFRNIPFKLAREQSQIQPEYDRVDLTVIEDSLLKLSFLHDSYGNNDMKITLSDTWMLGQEVAPQASQTILDIENNKQEQDLTYTLSKGRHYTLTVFYLGTPELKDDGTAKCSLYDATLSIAHIPDLVQESRCSEKQHAECFLKTLPQEINDRDLDGDGVYNFDQVLRLSSPSDFQGITKRNVSGTIHEALTKVISIKLSNNFDIKASIEYEYDLALFTVRLTEDITDDETGPDSVSSHLQSPLVFKGNDDHYKSVERELIADNVESYFKDRKHHLLFVDHQPELLHQIHPDHNSEGCIHVMVKIQIKSVKREEKNLYAEPTHQSRVAPMLTGVNPEDSPTFLHGRPEQVSFDLTFNKQPFEKDHIGDENTDHLKSGIRLKAQSVSLTDAVRSDVQIGPVAIHVSKKEYREDEYHVEAVFDVSEFQKSATEKLLSAQLVVKEDMVDQDGKAFEIEKQIKDRGLPIYVFEQNDEEQLLKEETSEVVAAVEETKVAEEAQQQESTDVMTEKSDLEAAVEKLEPEEIPKEHVECLCVHGTCRDDESECHGGCESGWTGNHCDVPSERKVENVNEDKKKDYTKDGLYRPQQISDARMTGEAKEKKQDVDEDEDLKPTHSSHGSKKKENDKQQVHAAKKIDDELPQQHHQATTPHHIADDLPSVHPEQPTYEPTTNPIEEPTEEKTNSWTSFAMVAAVLGFIWALYEGHIALPCPPKRSNKKYGAIPGREQGDDSDDDGDDASARRQMVELSSFGAKKTGVPSQRASVVQSDSSSPNRRGDQQNSGSFPFTNFSGGQPASVGNQSRQGASPTKATDSMDASQIDDAAQELQRELELFAQDDDEEASSLIQTEYQEAIQPQNADQFGNRTGATQDDNAEIEEYENYFNQ